MVEFCFLTYKISWFTFLASNSKTDNFYSFKYKKNNFESLGMDVKQTFIFVFIINSFIPKHFSEQNKMQISFCLVKFGHLLNPHQTPGHTLASGMEKEFNFFHTVAYKEAGEKEGSIIHYHHNKNLCGIRGIKCHGAFCIRMSTCDWGRYCELRSWIGFEAGNNMYTYIRKRNRGPITSK